ncbi:hypothetical protein GW17_00056726 [Ensete ventricosum]|nr:hypothetical protein GW17_00056726 [Ensete ventricosum]
MGHWRAAPSRETGQTADRFILAFEECESVRPHLTVFPSVFQRKLPRANDGGWGRPLSGGNSVSSVKRREIRPFPVDCVRRLTRRLGARAFPSVSSLPFPPRLPKRAAGDGGGRGSLSRGRSVSIVRRRAPRPIVALRSPRNRSRRTSRRDGGEAADRGGGRDGGAWPVLADHPLRLPRQDHQVGPPNS